MALALFFSAWTAATATISSDGLPSGLIATVDPPAQLVVATGVAGDPLGLHRLAAYQSGAARPSEARDLFTFDIDPTPRRKAVVATGPHVAEPAPEVTLTLPEPPSLVGIVSDNQILTAVFMGIDGTIEFGCAGGTVSNGRYRVHVVEADSVTLVNTQTGRLLPMPLR